MKLQKTSLILSLVLIFTFSNVAQSLACSVNPFQSHWATTTPTGVQLRMTVAGVTAYFSMTPASFCGGKTANGTAAVKYKNNTMDVQVPFRCPGSRTPKGFASYDFVYHAGKLTDNHGLIWHRV